ncbi:MAG TPA: M13-type metalloendopeptidase [Steroidobacter sp.]
MKTKVFACSLAATFVLTACSVEPPAAPLAPAGILQSGVYQQNIDASVRPQDDFYRYVNGRWLDATQIPPDRSNYGAFSLLQEEAERDLKAILEEAAASRAAPGTDEQKVGDFYASFLDEATVEARGLQPLAAELERIDALSTKRDLAEYIGHGQRIAVAQPFFYYIAIDEKSSTEYVSIVHQTGLGMPDRDYYLSDDAKLKGVREKYRIYVKDLLAAAGTQNAEAAAQKIYALEERFAKAHWTRVQNRDAEKTYNRYDLAGLAKLMPSFDWQAFFAGAKVPESKVKAVIVTQPSYFEALDRAIAEVPIEDWRVYFRYKLLNAYAPDLPAKFVQLHFDFNQRTVSGIQELKPRWKRAVDTIDAAIGELAGKLYVERHFKPEAKRRVEELVENLKTAYAEGIDALEWMTPATKQKAHAKLALFTTKIGYPDKWKDWSALIVKRDDLIGNEMRAAAVAFDRNVGKLGGPIDKTEWLMTPQTVNAYYYPPANEIVFPAAILQPPFFNVAADDAINYGAIGAVIGHEISHGFDDQGRRYDGNGNLTDWWASEDNEEFMRRAKRLGAQYDALSPLPGTKVNGDLTMGENIADLAGVAMAYRAYKLSLKGRPAPVIDGYTGDQRFFIGWAQGWARKYREDELRRRLLTDPHAPSEYRTNVIVSNLEEFHRAFDVKPGDKMYRPPEERVRIW